MKFDRSDPLALGFSIHPAALISNHLALLVTRLQPRELQNGVGTLVPRVSAPSGCPTGTDGHHRFSRTLCTLFPSLSLSLSSPLSRGAPHFIRFSFICYLPAAAATTAAGYAPSGASAEAGLLSSNPTPFYKYITRPSGPLPRLSRPGPRRTVSLSHRNASLCRRWYVVGAPFA